MCTLSAITRDNGYYLAMNRDERLTRGDAIPPSKIDLGRTAAIYPRDSADGTWVAANNHGIALALLNWNDVPQPDTAKTRSRGAVIHALIGFISQDEVQKALQKLDLRNIWPFRLVGVFPAEKRISEWRWNQQKLESKFHEWKPRHWFSSSLSDEQASAQRGKICKAAWDMEDAGSLPWLRRLHCSHDNEPGPFSLCVHRENVETISFTEISCTPRDIAFNYFGGSPCSMQAFDHSVEMERIHRTVLLPDLN